MYPYADFFPPSFLVALGIISGILAAAYFPFLLFACISLCCIAVCVYYRAYIPLCIVAGSLLGYMSYSATLQQHQKIAHIHGLCTVTGTVIEYEKTEHPYYRTVLTVQLHHIETATEKLSVAGNLMVYCPRRPKVRVADTITLHAITLQPSKNLSTSSCAYTYCSYKDLAALSVVHRPRYSLTRFFHRCKQNLLRCAAAHLSPTTYAFFTSLFLGKKQKTAEWKQIEYLFGLWGIMHYVARSGLHLVVCMYLYSWIFRFLPLPRLFKHILLYVLCCIYFLCSWASVPFIRAFLTYSLQTIYSFFNCTLFAFHIFSLILAGTLLHSPLHLFCLNFQLSFALTGALTLLAHRRKLSSTMRSRF